jgi:hypothetical protein
LRVIECSLPPDGTELPEDFHTEFVGMFTDAEWDPDTPGMHRTTTIDTGTVLDGSIILELDDAVKTQLDPGDWYVQNGTRHAWRNPFDKPCRLAIFLWGAEGLAGQTRVE